MNTTVGRRILGWRPARNRPEPVPPWWEQWTTAACMALAPTRSGKSNPQALCAVLSTAHKAALLRWASAEVPRS